MSQPRFEHYKVLKARKEHKCVICQKPIKVGDLYTQRTTLKSFDTWETLRYHRRCEEQLSEELYQISLRIEDMNRELREPEPISLADHDDFSGDSQTLLMYYSI